MQLTIGNGAPIALDAECASATWNPSGATSASGYLLHGGVAPGLSTLFVDGCASKAASSVGISLNVPMVTAAGKYSGGGVTYTDTQGTPWSDTGGVDVTITELGGVGQTIAGSFTAAVVHPPSQIAQSIQVTFQVCRMADEDAP
jgi:hypothetical protein